MQTKDCCRKECVLTVSGILTAIMGLVMAILWPYIFENILHEELKLSKSSRAYEPWKSPPFPLSLDIYFFNWTNPDDIYLNGTKPVLEELGPYRFTELSDKVDIVWNDENSTVSYRKKSLYYFDEEGSQGRLDDMVTTVNIAALSAGNEIQIYNSRLQYYYYIFLNSRTCQTLDISDEERCFDRTDSLWTRVVGY